MVDRDGELNAAEVVDEAAGFESWVCLDGGGGVGTEKVGEGFGADEGERIFRQGNVFGFVVDLAAGAEDGEGEFLGGGFLKEAVGGLVAFFRRVGCFGEVGKCVLGLCAEEILGDFFGAVFALAEVVV